MKYIDADRLRKAVEKKYNDGDSTGDRWDLGYDSACEQILEIIDSLQQEQPDTLESEKPVPKVLEEAARHSEILTYPMPEDGDIEKVFKVQEARVFHEIGFIAGAKWDRKQMLKEAVEGEVMTNGFYPYEPRIVAPYPNCPYDFGDKVRIIIIKE